MKTSTSGNYIRNWKLKISGYGYPDILQFLGNYTQKLNNFQHGYLEIDILWSIDSGKILSTKSHATVPLIKFFIC